MGHTVAWSWRGPLWAALCYLGAPRETRTEALEVFSQPTPTASRKTLRLGFPDSHAFRRLRTTRPHVALSSASGQVSRTGVCDQELGSVRVTIQVLLGVSSVTSLLQGSISWAAL